MRFELIRLESIGIISKFWNLMYNRLVFSSSMLGFNALVICCWLAAPDISSGDVQSVVQPTSNDGGKP